MAFLCGRGFPPTASLGQGSLGAPLQQFPPRPLPLPLKGPAQDSRESGRAWGEPGASFRAGRGRPQAERVAEGTRGGRGRRGTTREPRRRRPGIPPQALRKTRKAVLQPPSPPEPSPADLSLLLNGSPLEHSSRVVTSPLSLLPCPGTPLLTGYLIPIIGSSPRPGIVYTPAPGVSGEEKPGCVGVRKGTATGLSCPGKPAVLLVFRGGVG